MVTTAMTTIGALTVMYLLAGLVMFSRNRQSILFRGDTVDNPRWLTVSLALLTWLPYRIHRKNKEL
jgi:hypothetical protein